MGIPRNSLRVLDCSVEPAERGDSLSITSSLVSCWVGIIFVPTRPLGQVCGRMRPMASFMLRSASVGARPRPSAGCAGRHFSHHLCDDSLVPPLSSPRSRRYWSMGKLLITSELMHQSHGLPPTSSCGPECPNSMCCSAPVCSSPTARRTPPWSRHRAGLALPPHRDTDGGSRGRWPAPCGRCPPRVCRAPEGGRAPARAVS